MLDLKRHDPVTVSLDVVWQGSSGKQDARMSEISMEGCYIDTKVQGRNLGDTIDFKVHLPGGPWVSLQGELINQEYPIGFGLRFTHLMETDRRLLARVVAAYGGTASEKGAELKPPVVLPKEEPKFPGPRAGERSKVLLADDDDLTLRMLTAIVEAEGYEAVPAQDGRQALEILQRDAQFSAAIFDMTMPYLKGLDLILFMKADERLRHVPIGMITAEQDPKVWDDSVAAGASVFLPKPFTPPQVKMLLRMLVRPSGS
jgi:CheY-like chemotaxis protein